MEEKLKKIFGDRLKANEPLSAHSTFRVGGPAKWFVEARTAAEITKAVELCQQEQIDFAVIGGGTNMLASDSGYDGLVIKMANRAYEIQGNKIFAEAGALTVAVARAAADADLTEFEWAVAVPGTIGGAVYGNAGCFGGEMKDVVERVRIIRDGQVQELTNQELQFGYRDSILKGTNDIVLDVTLVLEPGTEEEIKSKMNEFLEKRKASQPLGASCAGCTFKNFEYSDESEIDILKRSDQVPEAMLENKLISAGWLIDEAGLKGETIGGASVSTDHGNFIVNDGTATADQIIQLISKIKMRVRDEYGIQLQEEIQYL